MQIVAPLPAAPSLPAEDIVIDASPEIEIEEPAPEKAEEALQKQIEAYIASGDYKQAVNEAIEVALAKLRGKVI
jgi:hypothetical protein